MKKPLLTGTYATANLMMQQSKNMDATEKTSSANPASPETEKKFNDVKFIHTRSPEFRTFHADGSWAVVNAKNMIHMNFYSEFPQIVTGVINLVDKTNGKYTGEYEMQGLDKNYTVIVREFQCSVALSVENAEQLHNLLKTFIDFTKKQNSDQQAATVEKK